MMEKTEKKVPAHESPLCHLFFQRHYLLTYRFFIAVISTVFVIGGSGYLIDQTFNTKPLFLIISLVIALPLSILVAVKMTKNLIKKITNGRNSKN